MKVSQITNIIDTYQLYKTKINADKNRLFWEELNNGETDKTEKLRKQIKQDEQALGKFMDEEV